MDSNIVRHIVENLHQNPIAFSCNEPRPGKHSVYRHNTLRFAQTRHVLLHNLAQQNKNTLKKGKNTIYQTLLYQITYVKRVVSCDAGGGLRQRCGGEKGEHQSEERRHRFSYFDASKQACVWKWWVPVLCIYNEKWIR